MRTSLRFSLAAAILWASQAAAGVPEPCTRHVQIQPITEAVIPVFLGRGVKLIFPWKLRGPQTDIPFSARLSNSTIFQLDDLVRGQNHLMVGYRSVSPAYHGQQVDLLITTRGYHVSLLLVATNRLDDYCTNIVFDLPEAERMELIDDELARYRKRLEQARSQLKAEQAELVQEQALQLVGKLASEDPDEDNIHAESEIETPEGDYVLAYVEDVQHYGGFSVFRLEVENDSLGTPLRIENLTLSKRRGGERQALAGAANIDGSIAPGETAYGTYTVRGTETALTEDMVLQIATSQGKVEVLW